MTSMDVAQRLADQITKSGPISVADYMNAASQAYYERADVFGQSGDFVTAPEISQVFGELVGLWCVTAWQAIGQPRDFHLVELGPGRGTLMADAMRTAEDVARPFFHSANIHLVERSQARRSQQDVALSRFAPEWHEDLSSIPDGPVIIVGNEFLDALPVRQYEKTAHGWCERLVGVTSDGFTFTKSALPTTEIDEAFDEAPLGSIIEHSNAVETVTKEIAELCVHRPGIALLVDYGHVHSDIGETLQAVKQHSYHPVLQDPGSADVTAHVDFALVTQSARSAGARVSGPVEQGLWLERLGIAVREEQLVDGKQADEAGRIRTGIRRLTDPEAMGRLFKVIAFGPKETSALAGFETGF